MRITITDHGNTIHIDIPPSERAGQTFTVEAAKRIVEEQIAKYERSGRIRYAVPQPTLEPTDGVWVSRNLLVPFMPKLREWFGCQVEGATLEDIISLLVSECEKLG